MVNSSWETQLYNGGLIFATGENKILAKNTMYKCFGTIQTKLTSVQKNNNCNSPPIGACLRCRFCIAIDGMNTISAY